MILQYSDMKTIHDFMEWIKENKRDLMDDQQKEFFNNAFRWYDNIFVTMGEMIEIVKHDTNHTYPKIEIPFNLCMDIVSLKRQYFNEWHLNGLPF